MLTAKSDFRSSPQIGTVGMWLFLASLAMLFLATMVGYAVIRFAGAHSPELGTIHLPHTLWISTVLVLAASFTIHLASRAARAERQADMRKYLVVTLLLAVAFVVVQTPAMTSLVGQHLDNLRLAGATGGFAGDTTSTDATPNRLYGLVFILVLIHALHVIGGVVNLAWVTVRAGQGAYDHENYNGVKHAAMYWHFLDVVWIVMFGMLFIAG